MPRWTKGQTGNPKGRPKHDSAFTAALRAKGTADELATLAWTAARQGAPWAIQMIFNRLEPSSVPGNSIPEKTNVPSIDYRRFAPDELQQLETLFQRARNRTAAHPGGDSPPQSA